MERQDAGSLWFRTVCLRNGLVVADEDLGELESFVRLLLQANQSINLISRKDEENIWQNHILHSVSPLFRVVLPRKAKYLDLGTGGGLPGIPLKILLKDATFTLVDSVEKKTRAVKDIVESLGIRGVSVVCGRAEVLGKERDFKEMFDFVVSRAVAPLQKLVVWARPFVRKSLESPRENTEGKYVLGGGTLLAFKGGDLKKEISGLLARSPADGIQEIPLVFKGSEALSLVDKKLVIVRL